jgi:uncharacterized membrane protein YphA (DoxX/SURF4 family)
MNKKDCAPVVLRIGLSFIFLWFGLTQLFDQSAWVSFIPEFVTKSTGLSAETFVIFNGIFEVFFASLLAFGIWTRLVASLLFIHMFAIIADVGLSPIGIRDIGLMFALLSVAFFGSDKHSISHTEEEVVIK